MFSDTLIPLLVTHRFFFELFEPIQTVRSMDGPWSRAEPCQSNIGALAHRTYCIHMQTSGTWVLALPNLGYNSVLYGTIEACRQRVQNA
jgi:hypothetical protein